MGILDGINIPAPTPDSPKEATKKEGLGSVLEQMSAAFLEKQADLQSAKEFARANPDVYAPIGNPLGDYIAPLAPVEEAPPEEALPGNPELSEKVQKGGSEKGGAEEAEPAESEEDRQAREAAEAYNAALLRFDEAMGENRNKYDLDKIEGIGGKFGFTGTETYNLIADAIEDKDTMTGTGGMKNGKEERPKPLSNIDKSLAFAILLESPKAQSVSTSQLEEMAGKQDVNAFYRVSALGLLQVRKDFGAVPEEEKANFDYRSSFYKIVNPIDNSVQLR